MLVLYCGRALARERSNRLIARKRHPTVKYETLNFICSAAIDLLVTKIALRNHIHADDTIETRSLANRSEWFLVFQSL
jgi:hypothetical protein